MFSMHEFIQHSSVPGEYEHLDLSKKGPFKSASKNKMAISSKMATIISTYLQYQRGLPPLVKVYTWHIQKNNGANIWGSKVKCSFLRNRVYRSDGFHC
jgi:hypothetical protein